MINKNGYLLTAALFSLIFMTACSKNLMPPEGLDGTTLSGQSGQSAAVWFCWYHCRSCSTVMTLAEDDPSP